MSRIGKQPIEIPQGIEVKIEGTKVSIKGPKGELGLDLHPWVKAEIKDNKIIVSVKNPEDKKHKALWGLFKRLITNIIEGVTKGFQRQLEIVGVGYKVDLKGNKLILQVGFSHPIEYQLPEGITAKIEDNIITLLGIDKQKVGQVAAEIRKIKKPEPYKGKGIKYIGEEIKRKAGKSTVKTE